MDSREWHLFAEKVMDAMSADKEGIYKDMRPEIEKRLFEANPDKNNVLESKQADD